MLEATIKKLEANLQYEREEKQRITNELNDKIAECDELKADLDMTRQDLADEKELVKLREAEIDALKEFIKSLEIQIEELN